MLLSLQGLLMVRTFLFHFLLNEWICRTTSLALNFSLYLKSLRPKVRQRPSGADQYALGLFLVPLFSFVQPVPRELCHLGYI